ncbi:primosomal protein N' [Buchnera aphidicola (Aphis helianthi)]|uniref:Replication restart protein PriA n=1 Tax=Buchnera aphidicola (Aphis helianthi) TaxID=2315802 RepID=A0A4D6XPG5_9GAMM|nr:primosomal protein N' [Buchnera aphidicola]QCI16954.1 primosomal protein N' [Buchnera aphidicola (Aphis helianthi)]
MIIIDVILPFSIRSYFSYILPYSKTPIIGTRVVVPFNSKNVIGIVVAFNHKENAKHFNFKFVKCIIDHQPIFNASLLNTLTWVSKYYYYPIGSIFFSILPNVLKSKNIEVDENINNFFLNKNISKIDQFKTNKKFFLNKKILLQISKIIIKNSFASWLISEINLYIKIKFYLGLIEQILKKNLQILIIVPFEKYIYKILFFLKQYFNVPIDIIHSDLTDETFFKVWINTKNNQNSIIIGTKKSIFFPFLQLGLIIIYEEHNVTYKHVDKFKCNVRDIAIFRAYKENIPIILDSKTPSLKTLYNIMHKKFFWISLSQKNSSLMLKYQIIDIKKEKIRVGLSDTLIYEIFENIKKNFSVLLIFHPSDFIFLGLICRHCNWIPKCNVCNDYYEINKYNNIAFCRNCLINFKKPTFCYNCNFFPLTTLNFGIKKIKKNFKKIFPNISLLFLINLKDIKRKQLNSQLFNFSIVHSGIIISTEKIVQNYYFPNVELIGLVNIDYYLFSLKFYNIEYFYQFYLNLVNLTQKNSKFLNIFIQTTIPHNKYLINICNEKYFFCARNLLYLRKKFLLPPWNCQVILYCQSKNFRKTYNFLKFIYTLLKNESKKDNVLLWFVGPDPVFYNTQKKCFYKLLIQCSSRIYLQKILRISLEISKHFSIFNCVKWFIDFDIN